MKKGVKTSKIEETRVSGRVTRTETAKQNKLREKGHVASRDSCQEDPSRDAREVKCRNCP